MCLLWLTTSSYSFSQDTQIQPPRLSLLSVCTRFCNHSNARYPMSHFMHPLYSTGVTHRTSLQQLCWRMRDSRWFQTLFQKTHKVCRYGCSCQRKREVYLPVPVLMCSTVHPNSSQVPLFEWHEILIIISETK